NGGKIMPVIPMSYRIVATIIACVAIVTGLRMWHGHEMHENEFVAGQEFDFGEGRVGSTVHHVFSLNNPLDRPIHVVRQVTTCSCTVPATKIELLPAHSATAIPVDFRLGEESPRITTEVALVCENHPPISLRLVGKAIAAVPARIDFGIFR